MEVERVARKLEPLMPEQVRRWMKARELADPEFRGLIERQILAVAQRKLGDYPRRCLLSLPPSERIKGEFTLGTVLYDKPRWTAGVSRGELLQHCAVFGRSGSGKSTLVFNLLEQLSAKGIPWLFIDWKRSARHLLPVLRGHVNVYTPGRSLAPLVFNPFIVPPGLEQDVYFTLLIDILAEAFTLGDGACSILLKAIQHAVASAPGVSADSVLEALESLPSTERARRWKLSAIRALETLQHAQIASADSETQQRQMERLCHERTIIEMDAVSASVKAFLIPMLCLWIYHTSMSWKEREQLRLVIVLEEAHHILHRQSQKTRETAMEMLLRQCRELGIGFIIVDQHPSLISTACTGNIFASICLNLKDPRDVSRAAGISLVDDSEKHWFSRLPVGQAIVKLQDRWHAPFLIAIPKSNIQKGLMSDAMLHRYVRDKRAVTASICRRRQDLGQVPRIHDVDDLLDGDELVLLEDVLVHADDGVRARNSRLGFSAGKGQRLKDRLQRLGWLESALIPVGNSRKVVLRLSREGLKLLGLERVSQQRHESIAHEYWKHHYARQLVQAGYAVEVEAAIAGGRIDVLASKDDTRIAVEIETGRSDVVANVRRCLAARFDKVIVVVTDERSMPRIERELVKNKLLIPTRTQIIVAGAVLDVVNSAHRAG